MFTGLVEEIGTIHSIQRQGNGASLHIEAHEILQDIHVGDSIAIDGVCLTVTHHTSHRFAVQAVSETLSRSTLGSKRNGDSVNLERALRADGRFGGHIVQGHVDGLGHITHIESRELGYWLTLEVPEALMPYIVEKGSITLDGLSLTVAALNATRISIAIIPHTWNATTMKYKKMGHKLNIEVDILAKYVNKQLQPYREKDGISLQKMKDLGF